MSQDPGINVDAFKPSDGTLVGAPELLARHGLKKLKHIKLKRRLYKGSVAASKMFSK